MRKGIISSILNRSGDVPRPVRERLVAVVESDMATELLEKYEQQQVSKRAALLARLAELPKAHEKEIAAAAKRRSDAQAAHERALEQARLALTQFGEAYTASLAAQEGLDSQTRRIERELMETADPLIFEFMTELNRLDDLARLNINSWVTTSKNIFNEVVTHRDSNIGDVQRAREAIADALSTCRTMQMSALTSAQVLEKIGLLVASLGDALLPLNLLPPEIKDSQLASKTPRDAYRVFM